MVCRFFSVLAVFLVLSSCSNQKVELLNDYVELQSSFVLEDLGAAAQYLFTEDAIYCSNMETFIKVHKYNFQGRKLFEFGDNGEGPGEFRFVNTIYQDARQKLIGIPDMYLNRTTYIDSLGNFIKVEKFTKSQTLFQVVSSSTAAMKRFIKYSTQDGERVSHNTFVLERADNSSKLIYEFSNPVKLSYDPNGAGDKLSWIQMNETHVFYSKHYSSHKEYEIEMFDYEGNMQLWKPEFIPKRINKLALNFVSESYIYIDSYDDDKNYILVYDFTGSYLGQILLSDGQNLMGVKGNNLFIKNVSGEENVMEIYRIKDFNSTSL